MMKEEKGIRPEIEFDIEEQNFLDAEGRRHRNLVYYIHLVTSAFTASYGVLFWMNGYPGIAAINFVCVAGFLLSAYLAKKGFSTERLGVAYVLIGLVSIYTNILYTGAFYSPGLPWITSNPMFAYLLVGKRFGFFALIANLICLVLLFIVEQSHSISFPDLSSNFTSMEQNQLSSLIGTLGLLFLIAFLFDQTRRRAMKELGKRNGIIAREKQRSENLLLNILPVEVAGELKENGHFKARRYEEVTVMFTDFKDFTKISENLSPEELVREIDFLFRKFDDIIQKYGIEKIKTIGDSYMCAIGLSESPGNETLQIARAALEIRDFIADLKQERASRQQPFFDIRIGLHTGPVVAGIVGFKKFAYDIWGDTVNTAARMEQSGAPGKVNISGDTFERIKPWAITAHRGKVEAKNKGMMDMYFLESLHNHATTNETAPS